MAVDPSFQSQLLDSVPGLRAFAVSLCGNVTRADDLVQETLTKAWAKRDTFEPGTNLQAWLFTILRNGFYSHMRKAKREAEDADDVMANKLSSPAAQIAHLHVQDMKQALARLPDDQREAIILVAASGYSYEEAAEICGAAVGTIKSRVSRARTRLVELLGEMDDDELSPNQKLVEAVSIAG